MSKNTYTIPWVDAFRIYVVPVILEQLEKPETSERLWQKQVEHEKTMKSAERAERAEYLKNRSRGNGFIDDDDVYQHSMIGLLKAAEEEWDKGVFDETLPVLLQEVSNVVEIACPAHKAAVLLAAKILRQVAKKGPKPREASTKGRLKRTSINRIAHARGMTVAQYKSAVAKEMLCVSDETIRNDFYPKRRRPKVG
jgi:hypothetical protein